jgi:hypothetical protein
MIFASSPFRIRIAVASLLLAVATGGTARAQDPNSPGILEPVLSEVNGTEVRIPHTDQADGNTLLNVVGSITRSDARNSISLMGHPISSVASPNDDMRQSLAGVRDAAMAGDASAMQAAAQELMDILLGNTQGRIYDGFAMLNHNRGAFLPDQLMGEYKMKALRNTGMTELGIDGETRQIWEVDVSLLYYDGQIDSDTFLLRVPVDVHEFDTIRINYTIYSLETEDFSPTVVMTDYRMPGSVQFPFKGFDSVWTPIQNQEVTRLTVALPPNRLLRGVYTWGWREHPPRIQFLQPVWEQVNAHSNEVELEPQGESYAFRNRMLSLDGIGNAAPEKKMCLVADAALNGAPPATIAEWLNQSAQGPRGTWDEWADLASDQRQLPPEAWDLLAGEGIPMGQFGPYRMVTVYMNGEMYGEGPDGTTIEGWGQGDRFQVKLINLDNYTHYFRNVDFGPRLHDDIAGCCGAGSHSFEIMNFKPSYGAPKVAEMQWRAGWGFRPHLNIIQQQGVFPRPGDNARVRPFFGGFGQQFLGYQYSPASRRGDFRFNPPGFIITERGHEPPFPLREEDMTDGLLIGQRTEGYGTAKMCDASEFPLGGFCERDLGPWNPNGILNVDTDNNGQNDVLWFPPFLRNPNASEGGDIIPPTAAWKPFLYINPNNGTLFIDPGDPSQGYWVDRTYAHGTPVFAGGSLAATIEMPRAAAQVFYQFDDLHHDNAIFSPHPTGAVAGVPSGNDPAAGGGPSASPKLALAYPNPALSRATVAYQLQAPGPVTIAAYDVSGRLVHRHTEVHRTGGIKQHTLDGSELSSGVYHVRISSPAGELSTMVTFVR